MNPFSRLINWWKTRKDPKVTIRFKRFGIPFDAAFLEGRPISYSVEYRSAEDVRTLDGVIVEGKPYRRFTIELE